MSNWPVLHPEAEIERDKMVSTHTAYDLNGELVAPNCCKTVLPGAIARITFTLTHWFIDNNSKDQTAASATNSFVADVQSIRILVNPASQAMSPGKRKTARRDPGDESPTKWATRY